MTDFAAARRMMVDGQIRTSDVFDPRLLAAMLSLPRERFVPPQQTGLAYLDLTVPVADGPGGAARRLLTPRTLAKLIQAAQPGDTDRVLDIGCATGYAAALLGRLAGSVVALDDDKELARQAERAIADADVDNVEVVSGALTGGWQAGAPYDIILIEGAIEILPQAVTSQLRDGGRLVCIRGRGPAAKAMLYRSDMGEISGRAVFDAAAPLLPGFAEPAAFVF